MPSRPGRLCGESGCGAIATYQGRCQAHNRQNWTRIERQRGTATQRGYDSQWRRVRERVLQRDEYCCVRCKAQGVVTLAGEVDHIVPLAQGGARLEPSNLQSLCHEHHSEKTAREAGQKGQR